MRITELEKGRDRLFEHLGAIGASDLQNSLVLSLADELIDLETQVVQEQARLETLHEVAPKPSSHRCHCGCAGICAGVLVTLFAQSLATVGERAKSDVKR